MVEVGLVYKNESYEYETFISLQNRQVTACGDRHVRDCGIGGGVQWAGPVSRRRADNPNPVPGDDSQQNHSLVQH